MRHAFALGMTFANLDGSPPDCGSSACGAKRGARVWPLQFSNEHMKCTKNLLLFYLKSKADLNCTT